VTGTPAFSYWAARLGRSFGYGRRTDPDELCHPELFAVCRIQAEDELIRDHSPALPYDLGDILTTLIALDYPLEVALAAALNVVCANDDAVNLL
jgi:hypothetical protein